MKSTIIKRSIVLKGRKTSVSLETEFWDGLREIACAQKAKLTELTHRSTKTGKAPIYPQLSACSFSITYVPPALGHQCSMRKN